MTQALLQSIALERETARGSNQPSIFNRMGGIAENPDKVVRKKGLRAYEEMERKDAHYGAVLDSRKSALLENGYIIEPGSDDARDQEIAEFIRWALDTMSGSFEQDLYEILDALGKGYSVTEINYQLIERGPWQGKTGLKSLKAKDQEFYGFDLDEFDNIKPDGLVQNPSGSSSLRIGVPTGEQSVNPAPGSASPEDNVHLPIDKFIHFVFDGRAENPYGRGLAGKVYWYSWFKSEGGFKFWMVFLDKFGSPTGVVKKTENYQGSGDSDADNRNLANTILKKFQQETGVVLPEGIELDLLEAARAGDAGYQRLIQQCNDEISKAVLGQTLTTELGGPNGSRSMGEVHQGTLMRINKRDASLLEPAINEQLIRRLVDFNWRDVEFYPKLKLPLKSQRDFKEDADAIGSLVDHGAQIPMKWVNKEYGIPEPEEGEAVLGRSAVQPGPGDGRPAEPGPAEPFAERPITRNQIAPPEFRRRLLREQDNLVELGTAQGRAAVKDILEVAIEQARKGGFVETGRGAFSLNMRPFREALLNTVVLANLTGREQTVDLLDSKGVTFSKERLEAFQEVDQIVGPKEAIELFRARVPMTQAEFARLVGAARNKAFAVAGIEEMNLLQLVQARLLEAIENGTGFDHFAAGVREDGVRYTGRAFGQALAGETLKDSHMQLIFRNNTAAAYNQGRRAILEDADVVDSVPFYLYDAIDDDRVRPKHRAMDGKIYRRDHPIWDTWWPPNGHHCRCSVMPVTVDEAERLTEDQISTTAPVVEGAPAEPDKGFGSV